MRKVNNNNKAKKEKKSFVKTTVKRNNTVEVEIQKNPAKTITGKIILALVVLGTIGIPVAALIYLFVQMGK